MFTKKVYVDIKKSAQKINDTKKDILTRYKHLRNIIEHSDTKELKAFFESNYSTIYHIFYENFIIAETNLKQRVHKAHREELEGILSVLDKILTLCPELVRSKWQCFSLTYVFSKLLHPANSWRLRREAMRYFILWYQTLGDDAPENVHAMYATLVPGFPSIFEKNSGLPALMKQQTGASYGSPINAAEVTPIYPPPSGEKQPEDEMRYFLDALLEFMVTQVTRIKWNESWVERPHKCFVFLFETFKKYYLPYIFPDYSNSTNIYKPSPELPCLRASPRIDEFISCRVCFIKWMANFTHDSKPKEDKFILQQLPHTRAPLVPQDGEHQRKEGLTSGPDNSPNSSLQSAEDPLSISFQVVRDVFYSSRENVNFIHEIYRQAFLLNFDSSAAIRRTIAVYKDWIQNNVSEIPPFMLEPLESEEFSSLESSNTVSDSGSCGRPVRLRNDSYVGAISKENLFIRAGLQNVLQVFVTNAANVFLLETDTEHPVLVEEQVDTCKRVLNMYRYMVMHTYMEPKTWEQLLLALMKITSSILPVYPPKKKDTIPGGRLAPAIFQTLIVTWIKANLNVVVGPHLWDQLLEVLGSLTRWEELIREWAKTMETLTRVLARHVYKLDLMDLPLDRLTEQKAKRKRALTGIVKKRTEFADSSCKTTESSVIMEDADSEPQQEEITITNSTTVVMKMMRSLSDSNIFYSAKKIKSRTSSSDTSRSPEPVLESSSEKVKRVSSARRRWHSLDSLRRYSKEGMDSGQHSRCSSPAPSSGVECNSIKDAPIQIDVMSGEQHNSLDTSSEEDRRSVMAGGNVRGWLPDVAVVLWKRMLCILGNVNEIPEPNLHSQVFHYLNELSATLVKLYYNQGIPEDNQPTPQMPELIPPITHFAPWSFQALQLPDTYIRGKLSAYKLLCCTTLTALNQMLSPLHITMFLNVLRNALTSPDKNIVYTVMKYTGQRYFSRQLPGYTLLIPEFVHASSTVLSSDDLGIAPRAEAVSVLGSLLSLLEPVSKFPTFQRSDINVSILNARIMKLLIHTAKKEQSGLARAMALSSLGIFLLREVHVENKHQNFKEAYNTLLLALKFNHDTIAQVAVDVLTLLCDYTDVLMKIYPELPPRTIEVIANTLGSMIPIIDGKKRLMTSLLFLMAEWTMRVPLHVLKQKRSSNTTLILSVFKVLAELSNKEATKPITVGGHFNPELVKEFNPNITVDDLKLEEGDRCFDSPSLPTSHMNSGKQSLQIAARMIMSHLIENLAQFPVIPGVSTLSSLVTEQDDIPGLVANDQSNVEMFSRPDIQMFVTMDHRIISFIELPQLENVGYDIPEGYIVTPTCVRVVLRTLNGKYCWDGSVLQPEFDIDCAPDPQQYLSENLRLDKAKDSTHIPPATPRTMRRRPPDVLPTVDNAASDMDNLDDLLQYLSYTSPELLEDPERPLNAPSCKTSIPKDMEDQMISAILSQKYQEQEYLKQNAHLLAPTPARRPKESDFEWQNSFSLFRLCRLFMSHLGFFSWEHRKHVYLLQKNEKVLRELRNLDAQPCRETHKIAIIYVANGQEDKASILSNTGGSQNYENFIAALAWEVELEAHTGFMGGLQRNKSTGVTAPYYATSLMEVIFHVSTRIPSNTEEAFIQKTRHLGNDEVHIVWSEHSRDYRRGIIPTDFCDILIVICPLPLNLFRLQISRKPEVPYFGPLFSEIVVDWQILPTLVRNIAINASRAKRSMLPFYQQYYEERFRLLENMVRNYRSNTTFEEFVAQCVRPSPSTIYERAGRIAGGSFRNFGSSVDGSFQSSHSGPPSSNLTTTLTDTNLSIETESSHSWSSSGGIDTEASTGISPRPFKKISSKTSSRRSLMPTSLTPPDSPTSRKAK